MTGGKLKLGGKHKRGERGSVEEEQTCKRSNMASEESEFIDEETNNTQTEEPTWLELKEMLVDIKIELSNIVRENNKLANEMAGLRNTIQEQSRTGFLEIVDYKGREGKHRLRNRAKRSKKKN